MSYSVSSSFSAIFPTCFWNCIYRYIIAGERSKFNGLVPAFSRMCPNCTTLSSYIEVYTFYTDHMIGMSSLPHACRTSSELRLSMSVFAHVTIIEHVSTVFAHATGFQ